MSATDCALDQLDKSSSEDGPELFSRSIYDTTVTLDDGEYKAFLSLFYNHMALVAMRSTQDNRIRRYTWRYDVVEEVRPYDLNQLTILYTIMGKSCGNNIQKLDLLFPSSDERDSFLFRIKTLSNLYKTERKKLVSGNTLCRRPRNNSESSYTDSETVEEPTELPEPVKSESMNIQIDDMFSAENLAKIAKSKAASSNPSNTKSSDAVNIRIPIELDTGISNFTLKAEAVMKLQLKLDLPAICGCLKIADRTTRLSKIRQLIQFDSTDCELAFV